MRTFMKFNDITDKDFSEVNKVQFDSNTLILLFT